MSWFSLYYFGHKLKCPERLQDFQHSVKLEVDVSVLLNVILKAPMFIKVHLKLRKVLLAVMKIIQIGHSHR